jgi:hypothetical protein
MVVVPLTRGEYEAGVGTCDDGAESTNWIRYAAAGTLAASGVLLVTGQRRLGLVTALSAGSRAQVLGQASRVS